MVQRHYVRPVFGVGPFLPLLGTRQHGMRPAAGRHGACAVVARAVRADLVEQHVQDHAWKHAVPWPVPVPGGRHAAVDRLAGGLLQLGSPLSPTVWTMRGISTSCVSLDTMRQCALNMPSMCVSVLSNAGYRFSLRRAGSSSVQSVQRTASHAPRKIFSYGTRAPEWLGAEYPSIVPSTTLGSI